MSIERRISKRCDHCGHDYLWEVSMPGMTLHCCDKCNATWRLPKLDRFKQACWLHLDHTINRYLMSNAEGRWDGAEKAQRHMELCIFYVAVMRGIEEDTVRRTHEEDYQAVHTKTQELTDKLDTAIGFPVKGRPDYDDLAPKFFKKFHRLAMSVLDPEWSE